MFFYLINKIVDSTNPDDILNNYQKDFGLKEEKEFLGDVLIFITPW